MTHRYIVHADPVTRMGWIIRIENGKNFFKMTPDGERGWNDSCSMDGILDAISRNHWAEIDEEEALEICDSWDAAKTYQQYLEARATLGYHPDDALAEKVWAGCDFEARKDMVRQLREAVERVTALPDRYGVDAW